MNEYIDNSENTGNNQPKRKEVLVDNSPTEADIKGRDLISALRIKQKSAALILIEDGANIHYRDEVRCTALHYAATAGFHDLIIKLASNGANVKAWDTDGETPLHKASRAGREMAVVALVVYGADVHALNDKGKNALELAVERKHTTVIEKLCMFGTDLLMQNWELPTKAKYSKEKQDQQMMAMLTMQNKRSNGFRHSGIQFTVKHVSPDQDCEFKDLGVTFLSKDLKSACFIYCCKLHAEYTSFKHILREGQELFGYIYEFRIWGSSKKAYTLKFKIDGVPQRNETVDLISPGGKVGRIDSTSRNDDINNTDIAATISIKPRATTTVMFVTIEKPEVFSITKEAVTIQPQMEPEAEIDIPKDTFDSPGDLLLNVVQTKDVNLDVYDKKEDAILLTNVIDLSMSNRQQPKHPIDMRLPIHSSVTDNTEIAILSSSKEYPEDIDDWEIDNARKDPLRKCAAFQIRHFSIFTGVSKKQLDKDQVSVMKMVQKALNHEREVEFFVMVKTLPYNKFSAVVECALQRKAKSRRKHWRKQNFEEQEIESMFHTIPVNQWFIVEFKGNIKRTGTDSTEKMIFQPSRENFQTFDIGMVEETRLPMGRLKISLMNEKHKEPIEIVAPSGICKSKTTFIPREPSFDYFPLTELPIQLKPQAPEIEDMSDEGEDDDDGFDRQNTITVLKMRSIMQLSKVLNREEIYHLGMQLQVKGLGKISDDNPDTTEFLRYVLKEWRGKRPFASQVEFLFNALDGIGKEDEANAFKIAHIEKRVVQFL